MKQDQILEGNKLIDIFMANQQEFESDRLDALHHIEKGHINDYSQDLNVLMLVVEKIGDVAEYELVIANEYSYWNKFGDSALPTEFLGYGYPIEDGIFRAVVEFINWYNENRG